MATMKAVRLHKYEFPGGVVVEETERPVPEEGELLVRVHAAAVNPIDWMISEGYAKDWIGHKLPITLGCEFAGVVESTGESVYGYSNLARLGAFAEFLTVPAADVASMPDSLDFVQAATLPVAVTTASLALFATGGLESGQTVLIHAAAGGVGSVAVQLAKAHGAHVVGTASGRNAEFVRSLGADEVIDYTTTNFENAVSDVDVVFDLLGGETQERSISVVKKGGILVSAVEPPNENKLAAAGIRGTMIKADPDGNVLSEIADFIRDGKLVTNIEAVHPLSEAITALVQVKTGRTRGKIVLEV